MKVFILRMLRYILPFAFRASRHANDEHVFPVHAIRNALKTEVSHKRFLHSLSVAHVAVSLCRRFKQSIEKGYLAAILHDYAREYPDKKLLRFCRKHGIQISPAESAKPVFLHGKVAAHIAQHRFGIQDIDVLDAVANHTLGAPSLGPIGKIIFVADYIEPGRKGLAPGFFRSLEGLSLNGMVCAVIDHARSLGRPIAESSIALYAVCKKEANR